MYILVLRTPNLGLPSPCSVGKGKRAALEGASKGDKGPISDGTGGGLLCGLSLA